MWKSSCIFMNVECFWNMRKISLHKINAEIHCKCRNLPTNTEDLVSMLFVGGHGIQEFLDSGRKCWALDSRRWSLDARLWMLDFGRWTLDAGLWTLDTVVDCSRTESESSFWRCLIKLLNILWVRISKDPMTILILQRLLVLTWLFLEILY